MGIGVLVGVGVLVDIRPRVEVEWEVTLSHKGTEHDNRE